MKRIPVSLFQANELSFGALSLLRIVSKAFSAISFAHFSPVCDTNSEQKVSKHGV